MRGFGLVYSFSDIFGLTLWASSLFCLFFCLLTPITLATRLCWSLCRLILDILWVKFRPPILRCRRLLEWLWEKTLRLCLSPIRLIQLCCSLCIQVLDRLCNAMFKCVPIGRHRKRAPSISTTSSETGGPTPSKSTAVRISYAISEQTLPKQKLLEYLGLQEGSRSSIVLCVVISDNDIIECDALNTLEPEVTALVLCLRISSFQLPPTKEEEFPIANAIRKRNKNPSDRVVFRLAISLSPPREVLSVMQNSLEKEELLRNLSELA